MAFRLLIFSPNPQFLYFFPLMDHEMSRKYKIIYKSLPYAKKITLPLFLFFFFLSPFPLVRPRDISKGKLGFNNGFNLNKSFG